MEENNNEQEKPSFVADTYNPNADNNPGPVNNQMPVNDPNMNNMNNSYGPMPDPNNDLGPLPISNNMSSSYQPQENKQKNNKFMIIVIVVVLVIAIAVVLALVLKKDDSNSVNNSSNSNNSSNNSNTDNNKAKEDYLKRKEEERKKAEEEEKELANHYEIKSYETEYKDIVIEITNNNSIPIDAYFKIEFFDANHNLIDSKTSEAVNIAANYTEYCGVRASVYDFVSYKINTEITKSLVPELFNDKIEVSIVNETNESLIGQVKNNHTEKIASAEFFILYYNALGKVVFFDRESIPDLLAAGESTSINFSRPLNDDYKTPMEFSKYEIKVNYAYIASSNFDSY